MTHQHYPANEVHTITENGRGEDVEVAGTAGETCAVPYDTLARVLVGAVMGIVLQYLADRDRARAQRDLHALTDMLIALAAVRPAPKRPAADHRADTSGPP